MTTRQNLVKGIFKENPVFVYLLGMCSALAITSSVESSIGMGILVTLVLIGSNVVVSLVKKLIPDEVRIPCYIVIIATFVTIVKLLCEAFAADLYTSLGVFLSLIVVNCIILGRAEAYASKNSVFNSFIDAVGMGIGYTLAILLISLFRELLGTGAIVFGQVLPLGNVTVLRLFPEKYALSFLVQAPGAFIVLGLLLAIIPVIGNGIKRLTAKKESKQESKPVEMEGGKA